MNVSISIDLGQLINIQLPVNIAPLMIFSIDLYVLS